MGVLLGASVVLNVGLLLREAPPPVAPPAVVRIVETRTVEADPDVSRLRAENDLLQQKIATLESARPPADVPAPFVTDPVVADGLDILDAEDRLTDRMERGQLHRAMLEHVAAHLGLGEPARSRFISEGETVAGELFAIDAEYDAAVKQAYIDAGRDWTQAEVPAELRGRWDATKKHAEARLTAHLDLRDSKHDAFLKDHMHVFVWGYLSRSGFSWE